MPDIKERALGQPQPSVEGSSPVEYFRVDNLKDLTQLMTERLIVKRIDVFDQLHTSTALGIFENPEFQKKKVTYQRSMTLLPETHEQREAAIKIRSNVREMSIEARKAAAHDLAVATLQSSNNFPGLSHRIIPEKIKALKSHDRLKQLENEVKSLETKFPQRLYPTRLVQAAEDELVFLQNKGRKITPQLVSDIFRYYLDEFPLLPSEQKPPKIKSRGLRKVQSNKDSLPTEISSLGSRQAETNQTFQIKAPALERSISLLILSSITIPAAACASVPTETPVLTVGPQNGEGNQAQPSPSSESGEPSPTAETQLPAATVIPERPDFANGAGGQYSPEQVQLITEGAFQQQETILKNWIVDYWGRPEARNRPFHPESVEMHFIYFFDRNNPSESLVALQPGGDYGSRIFYLPIKDGQFMIVPPEAPEGEYDIPEGFGPLEISGGQWQLADFDGNWVRIDSDGNIREQLNLETAQWEEFSQVKLEVGKWAESDNGAIDPDILYPIVGSVFDADKRTIDLVEESSGLKLAVTLKEGTDLEEANLKQNIADQLNNQEDLKKQLEDIRTQLSEENDLKDNEKNHGIILIDGSDLSKPEITQIAIGSRIPIEKRYAFENGKIRLMSKEEEPLLMAPLSAPDARFIRTDTGEQVMMRGGNLFHFCWDPSVIKIDDIDRIFQTIKEMGGNYVVLPWNSGYINNSDYTDKLIKALKLAKFKYGFRIQLDLHSRGLDDSNNPYSNKHIDNLNSKITEDWENMLNDSMRAFWIGRTVDIYNLLSEPVYNTQGQNHPSFFDPINSTTCKVIRSSTDNPDAICSWSAGRWGWAGDATQLLKYQRTENEKEIVINVHPYRLDTSQDLRPDIWDYAQKLQDLGWNIIPSEIGWLDWYMNPGYVIKQMEFFEKQNMSYALVGWVGGYADNSEDIANMFIDYNLTQLSPTALKVEKVWAEFNNK